MITKTVPICMRIIIGYTVWDLSRNVNHLSKVIWDRKIITEFTRSICSARIGKPVLIKNIKVSKDKHIGKWVDRENFIYVRWLRIKNSAVKTKKVIDRGKRSITLSEVKPVENITKNLKSFLEINPVQKKVHPPHKLRDMHMSSRIISD